MAGGPSGRGETARQLAAALDDALELLDRHGSAPGTLSASAHSPESLLAQCVALWESASASRSEPVRALHQFACTGGTLVGRCISSMPNVQLLSEVDPLSRMQVIEGEMRFAPTDFVQLLYQSSRGVDEQTIVDLFHAGLELILTRCRAVGQRLVIRDHAHSKYCTGSGVAERPSVHELISSRFDTLAAVVVRHPLDSYLSLRNNQWMTFAPATVEEYALRYRAFLGDHHELPRFRYEDIVAKPEESVRELCDHLQVPFADGFADRFEQFRLTGDSGRSGGWIAPRPRRALDEDMERQLRDAPHYRSLLGELGYQE